MELCRFSSHNKTTPFIYQSIECTLKPKPKHRDSHLYLLLYTLFYSLIFISLNFVGSNVFFFFSFYKWYFRSLNRSEYFWEKINFQTPPNNIEIQNGFFLFLVSFHSLIRVQKCVKTCFESYGTKTWHMFRFTRTAMHAVNEKKTTTERTNKNLSTQSRNNDHKKT